MSEKCYALASQHQGEDFQWYDNIFCIYLDKKAAEEAAKKLNENYKQKVKWYHTFCKFKNKWNEENKKNLALLPYISTPKWPAGLTMKQITPEMRAERDNAAKQNKTIYAWNCAIEKDHHDKCISACREQCTMIPSDILEKLIKGSSYYDGDYEECKKEKYIVTELDLVKETA